MKKDKLTGMIAEDLYDNSKYDIIDCYLDTFTDAEKASWLQERIDYMTEDGSDREAEEARDMLTALVARVREEVGSIFRKTGTDSKTLYPLIDKIGHDNLLRILDWYQVKSLMESREERPGDGPGVQFSDIFEQNTVSFEDEKQGEKGMEYRYTVWCKWCCDHDNVNKEFHKPMTGDGFELHPNTPCGEFLSHLKSSHPNVAKSLKLV